MYFTFPVSCLHATYSRTLREANGLKVFKGRVLRKTVGAGREEVIGRRRKLQNEELHDWYFSSDIIRMSE